MTTCITVELALWLAKADFAPVRSIGIKPVFVSMHPHPVFSHNPRLTAHRARGRRIKPITERRAARRLSGRGRGAASAMRDGAAG